MESTSPSIRRMSSDGGGSVWRRIWAKYGERGPLVESSRSATHFGLKRRSPGSRYHAPMPAICAYRSSGTNVSGSGR